MKTNIFYPSPSKEFTANPANSVVAPTIQVENIALRTKNPDSESGVKDFSGPPTKKENLVSITSLLVQGSQDFLKCKSNYNNSEYTSQMRVRAVVSTNSKFGQDNLDYISQRCNEYLNGSMTTKGKDGVQDFYNQMAAVVPRSIMSPILPGGVFDTDRTTRSMKSADIFMKNAPTAGVYIYDAPLVETLQRNNLGETSFLKKQGKIIGGTSTEAITYTKISAQLKEIQIPIKESEVEYLSVHMFVYLDYSAFLEGYGLIDEKTTRSESETSFDSPMEIGMGYITSIAATGEKKVYKKQDSNTNVFGQEDSSFTDFSDSKTYVDEISAKELFEIGKLDSLLESFYRSMTVGISPGQAAAIKYRNYFSDLWISKNTDEDASYLFSFDKLAFLRDHSLYPKLYLNSATNAALFDDAGLSRVVDVKMVRRRIYRDRILASNDLATITSRSPYERTIDQQYKIIGTPKRIENIYSNNFSLDFYEGLDSYAEERKTEADALYQYGVTFYIQDGAALFLRNQASTFRKLIAQVEDLIEYLVSAPRSKGLYDHSLDMSLVPFSSVRVESPYLAQIRPATGTNFLVSGEIPIQRLVQKYFEIITLFNKDVLKISPDEFLSNYIGEKNLNHLRQFVGKCNLLEEKLDEMVALQFPNDTYNIGLVEKDVLKRKGFCQRKYNIIEMTHYFDNSYDLSDNYKSGYVYVPASARTDGLSRTNSQNLIKRIEEEFNKYFSRYDNDVLNSSEVAAANDRAHFQKAPFSNPAYAFYSPRKIKVYGMKDIDQISYKLNGTNQTKYNIDQYANLLAELIRRSRNKQYGFLEFSKRQLGVSGVQRLYNNVLDQLSLEGCIFVDDQEGIKTFFPPLKARKITDISTIDISGEAALKKSNQINLLPVIFGGKDDLAATTVSYYKSADKNIIDKDFTNLTEKDPKIIKNSSTRPIKLAFSILGQMEFTVKCFKDIAEMLSFSQQNSLKMIGEKMPDAPNQIKAMLIFSENKEQEDFGDGLDAVRNMFMELDPADDNRSISATTEGSKYPPYPSTEDPTKIYSKLAAFWMNYQQLAVLEYFSGFSENKRIPLTKDYTESVSPPNKEFYINKKNPLWRTLTPAALQAASGKNIICRIRFVNETDQISVETDVPSSLSQVAVTAPVTKLQSFEFAQEELFTLPIYNKYFILNA